MPWGRVALLLSQSFTTDDCRVSDVGIRLGAVWHPASGTATIHPHTLQHSCLVCELLSLFTLHVLPAGFCFSSVVLHCNDGPCQPDHDCDGPYVAVACGEFQEGACVLDGEVHDFSCKPILLDSAQSLSLQPCHGQRWVVTLFTCMQTEKLQLGDTHNLCQLGFRVPERPADCFQAALPSPSLYSPSELVIVEIGTVVSPGALAARMLGLNFQLFYSAASRDACAAISKMFPSAGIIATATSPLPLDFLAGLSLHCDTRVLFSVCVTSTDMHSMHWLHHQISEGKRFLSFEPLVIAYKCVESQPGCSVGDSGLFGESCVSWDALSLLPVNFSYLDIPLYRSCDAFWVSELNHLSEEYITVTGPDEPRLIDIPPLWQWSSEAEDVLLPTWTPCLKGSLLPFTRATWSWSSDAGLLVASEVAAATGANSPRSLHSVEIERILGLPEGFTDGIEKSDESLLARESRRRELLLRAPSVHMFKVLFLATVGVDDNGKRVGEPVVEHLDIGVQGAFCDARTWCPYNADRIDRGLPVTVLPPDEAEVNAHSANFLVEGLQSRRSAGRAAPVKAVPTGLRPEEHVAAGIAATLPLDAEPVAPDDLDFAVRTIVSLGPRIVEWRAARLQEFRQLVERVGPLSSVLASQRSANATACAAQMDLGAIKLAVHALAWPDLDLPYMLQQGANPLGEQASFGVFRQRHVEAATTCDALPMESKTSPAALTARPPPRPDHAAAIWCHTLEEQSLGFLSRFYDIHELDAMFGKNNWSALARFPLWQNGKWRMIDNGALGHNGTFAASETIHTTSSSAGAALARCFRLHHGRPLAHRWRLRGASRDMWKAYRQIPLHPEAQRHVIICIWHPEEARWLFVVSHVLLFGLSGAVLHFNRVSTFFTAFCRRVLAVPIQHFYDDFRVLDPILGGDSALEAIRQAASIFGFVFDEKKDQHFTPRLKLLGNIEDYSLVSVTDRVYVEALPERLESVRDTLGKVLQRQSISSAEAATIRGKLLNLAQAREGRTGRATLRALSAVADGQLRGWSAHLEWDITFALAALDQPHRRPYELSVRPSQQVRAWTDASFEPRGSSFFMRLCAIIHDEEKLRGIVADVPPHALDNCDDRTTQIALGELLAVVLLFKEFRESFNYASTIVFIDNMGVIYSLVNGVSASLDLGSLVHCVHHFLTAAHASVWFEHVPSASNIADGGSRVGIHDSLARRLRIPLIQIDFPELPQQFPFVSVKGWQSWWQQ